MQLRNLTKTAIVELRAIMRASRDFGPQNARALQADLLAIFASVAQGRALGHVRSDVSAGPSIRFVNVRRTLFVVVYDQDKRLVVRIIHGRRDFRALIFDEPDPSRGRFT